MFNPHTYAFHRHYKNRWSADGKEIDIRHDGGTSCSPDPGPIARPATQDPVDYPDPANIADHISSSSSIAPLLVISGNNTPKHSFNCSSFPARTRASVRTLRDSQSRTRTRSRSIHCEYVSSHTFSGMLKGALLPRRELGTQIITR